MEMTNAEIIGRAIARIEEYYVFDDKGREVGESLRGKLAEGAYEGLAGPELCALATGHFQEVAADKHLRLLWSEEPTPLEEDEEEAEQFFADMEIAENHGVHRVERLEGNIGYIDLRLITRPQSGWETINAAMTIVRHTSALILDLRLNEGGSPGGVAVWCSYLMHRPHGIHLNDIYERRTDFTKNFWTMPFVPGPQYLDRPLYVLTSADTFSGGEELAYNLKVNGRATLVGENTRGGAHPTEYFPITPHHTVTVPSARSINPVTGTNWEGVGIAPDVSLPADAAFDYAYQDALKAVAAE